MNAIQARRGCRVGGFGRFGGVLARLGAALAALLLSAAPAAGQEPIQIGAQQPRLIDNVVFHLPDGREIVRPAYLVTRTVTLPDGRAGVERIWAERREVRNPGGSRTVRYYPIRLLDGAGGAGGGDPGAGSVVVGGSPRTGGSGGEPGLGGAGEWDPWENTHSFTGLPMTEDGWTDLRAMFGHANLYKDSRIVYVSSSKGNDATGVVYGPGHGAVGGDPFEPAGTVAPFRTLKEAHRRLRDGYPDIMLLRRGDVWEEQIPMWTLSGRSVQERLIVGAYGPESAPRPVVQRFRTRFGPIHPDAHFSYMILTGLEFSGEGIDRLIGGDHWLIEDCGLFRFASTGVIIQGEGPEPLRNVALRRVVIADRHPVTGSGHIQGMYASKVDGLLVEQCVLDHNGWRPGVPGGQATTYNHNAYIQYSCSDVTFRGNISARASGTAVHQRSGGVSEDNLFLRNPVASFGYSMNSAGNFGPFGGMVRDNVVLDAADRHNLGIGYRLEALRDAEISGNIFAHRVSAQGNSAAIEFGHWGTSVQSAQNVAIRDNIVFNWGGGARGIKIEAPTQTSFSQFLITENQIDQGAGVVIQVPGEPQHLQGIKIRDNRYHSGHPSPFSPGGTFSEWRVAVDDERSDFGPHTYPDPGRDIASYLASLGVQAGQDATAAFLSEARQQRRGNWRPQFTAGHANSYIRAGFGR